MPAYTINYQVYYYDYIYIIYLLPSENQQVELIGFENFVFTYYIIIIP